MTIFLGILVILVLTIITDLLLIQLCLEIYEEFG